ncbi:Cullin-domain-containing protein [Terfezia boudieri ATCC MYA-4762]|uniref:Cullin-domain-containing protein n=1 Tax=Terfezia boudieri ATCC MYA-4762 TaxID=1051890 RepID=A0A3N4M1U2_9PEZI|nr:Cullin-domain-containing protein [Terfezia boudieri ATCC MYA-4762]
MSLRGRGKIRAPKRGINNDNFEFDDIWAVLSQSLQEIHHKNASSLSFEELYRNAYKLVLKKHGDKLYKEVKRLLADHLEQVGRDEVKPLCPGGGSQVAASLGTAAIERRDGGNRFLMGLKNAWEDHQLCLGMMRDVLMYLDRVYCVDNKEPSIYIAGMGLFRDHILRSRQNEIGRHLNSIILDQIQMERDGDSIDRGTIRSCVYMLEGLYETDEENENQKLYLTSFEGEFLQASTMFYKHEAERLLRECDAGTYLQRTNRRLEEEYSRSHNTLSPLTEVKIRGVVEKCLITDIIKEVMEMEGSGISVMLDHDRYEELKLLYQLIARVDNDKAILKEKTSARLIELGKEINRSISSTTATEQGSMEGEGAGEGSSKITAVAKEDKEAINATTLAIKWVDEVLALKDKYDRIWQLSFEGDKGMNTALSRAFSNFINDYPRSPEYMSLFIDDNLRKGLKGKTEEEVDQVLDKAITLFRYISDKDIFERYYKKHLSRRLLMGRSVSHDVEKQMIGKLKLEVGVAFTCRMEGMFKDMNISEDLTSEFKKHRPRTSEDGEASQTELSVHVLTPTFWPLQAMGGQEQQNTCTYPQEIEELREAFTKFYLNRHSGRKLQWQANMGTADVKAVYSGKKLEVNVSTYGMVILLAFNDVPPGGSLTFKELQTITSIPENDLIRNLQSLAVAPKNRLLKKEPMSKDVRPTDRFYYNENFQSKYLRIKIGVVANRAETEKERRETGNKVDETRAHQIEAAVVRIMKQRKQAVHGDLMLEVINLLSNRFKPDPAMIKKRIESLMEREYLERVDGERQTYRYLA